MIVRLLVLLVAMPAATFATHARHGRIDVYAAEGEFRVRDVRVGPGAQLSDVGWRGKGMARTGATAQARVRQHWREVWIEVVPEADGVLQINFQGEYYRRQSPGDVRRVWVDNVRVSGAELVNDDLEELDAKGAPKGWLFSTPPAADAVSGDRSVACSGKVCVAVWFGCQLRQHVRVRSGRPVRVTARFRALGPHVVPADVARHQAQFGPMLETRPQTVTVRLASPDAAKRAALRPLPLYGGAQWAVTSRWDDNHSAHVKMRKTLLAHGHRGTFFLNDPRRSGLGRQLLGDGITLGGHSLTHPMLAYQNRNRIFEEVLGVRIALEATFDTLVNAYAFSFCNYASALEGVAVQRDIAVALGRAGYFQVANHRFAAAGCWPLGVAGLLPPDGRPIDNAFAGFLADEIRQEENPAITFSMHTWYRTPEAWAKFEAELDRYGPRPDWWHCNHNEYGAYRAQFTRAARGRLARRHATLSFTFERPVLIDLNDPVPLTFEVVGVAAAEVKAIGAAGARVERVESPERTVRFHLHHLPGARLPTRIDHLAAGQKVAESAKFAGVQGRLAFDGGGLRLELRNAGDAPLKAVRVAYRLPLLAASGVVRRPRFDLPVGRTHTDVLPLGKMREDPRYRAGVLYAVAQLDFARGDEAGRLYLSSRATATMEAASYPWRGFLALGPIPCEAIDLAAVQPAAVRETGWTLPNGRKLAFKPVADAVARPLNVEVIPVRGRWSNRGLKPCVYLLASTVASPREREVRLRQSPHTVPAIWLNGRRVRDTATLRAGDNALLLAYEPPATQRFSPEHAGPAFRITDAKTGKRVDDIAYRR